MPGDEISARVDRLELPFDARGVDRYGVSKWHLAVGLRALGFLYRNYFRVRCDGLEHVPPRGRAMLVGNHSGGVALDGAMVIASCFLELDPPRLAQGMAEKFINRFPFASVWTAALRPVHRPARARRAAARGRPPAHGLPRGRARHRQALQGAPTRWWTSAPASCASRCRRSSPIVPFGFIGGGDAIPTVTNLYKLGKLLGVPYMPVTPWLLPLPLPVKLEIHYGEPHPLRRHAATRTTSARSATSSR